jgi:hypothetical protein
MLEAPSVGYGYFTLKKATLRQLAIPNEVVSTSGVTTSND